MKSILLFTAAVVISSGTLACTKKSSLEDFGFGPITRAKVAGPDISGHWDSGCIDSAFSSDSKRRITMDIEAQKMTYVESSFSDSQCLDKYEDSKLEGTFTFQRQLPNGIFTVEFLIPINANMSDVRLANFSKVGENLMFSDWRGGFAEDLTQVVPNVTLTPRESTPAPVAEELESGLYRQKTAGKREYCDQGVSTMKSGEKLAMVYIDLLEECAGTQFVLNCADGLCSDGANELRILNSTSYSLENLENKISLVFEKL